MYKKTATNYNTKHILLNISFANFMKMSLTLNRV